MATACWSSLPFDLIHRIAGCFLAAADLDFYMDFRAVCHNWRSATDDPSNTLDRRFRPHNWVMLDYPSHGEDARLLVNTATGRFHLKNTPLLRKYFVVAVTTDGLLLLAGRDVPHLACVLNPFTGYIVRFAARMRPGVVAGAVSGSSPPYLVIYCNDSMKLYRANPDSKCFVRYKKKYAYPLVRKAVQGCIAIDGHQDVLPPLHPGVVTKITDMMTAFVTDMPNPENIGSWKRCFLVESAGETLVIFKHGNAMEVFKVKMGGRHALEQVQSIGDRAIFIGGCHRCLSLDAGKFPSIEANCIYFTEYLGSPSTHIYHLKDGKQGQSVIATEDAPSVELPAFICNPLTAHPFTIILVISLYTLNCQAIQATQVLEYEDGLLEKLQTGQLSISDLLLQASMGDTDSESSDD
uniref:Uncharacterized protein n=1 Tax=Avena sativa TaxID=4498 RepID=A0ACD5YHJ3_AVESA